MHWKADYTLDVRESIMPLSLLKVTKIFRKMEANQVLEVIGYNPETRADFIKVLPASSFELHVMEEEESVCRIQIRKISG